MEHQDRSVSFFWFCAFDLLKKYKLLMKNLCISTVFSEKCVKMSSVRENKFPLHEK